MSTEPEGTPPDPQDSPTDAWITDLDSNLDLSQDQDLDAGTGGVVSVEDLLTLVETLTQERDAQLNARQRQQAEFENYRRRMNAQQQEQAERATESLVTKLLPMLDAFEGAVAHGAEGVAPLHSALLSTLAKEGLEPLSPSGEPFDPNQHDAVMHEDGDGGPETIAEVLRTGYVWKGRVIRPAMVKVRT